MSDDDDLMPVLQAWTDRVRADLGIDIPVDADTIGTLLKVASIAAHDVIRPAAPLTTYLIGLAMAADPGLTAKDALARVQHLAATPPPD